VSDPLWYKDAVFYQLRIPSFYDSNGDGIGDIRGLTEKLDYVQDLGVTTLWILPFYPSPLRDDGYDIAHYTEVHPDYGTLRDFRAFLREAHRRGLRVVTELVINHTSDQHPWFQRARRAPAGSRERDFYVWSDDPTRYAEARIIFKDFEHSNWSWDPVANAYYWHRFFAHQPDLNFDNPAVGRAVKRVLDFWFEMGVDGLRLDAVPYLFEREGTSCENLPETHTFLRELRAHVDSKFQDRMLLAEANQWPEDAVPYFGKGDECHMAFHFPIMPRLFMAIRMEDRYPILDILDQTPAIPDICQWAVFLRNHDELTLEMVTDEERDYMWRVYARDRRARINLGIRRRLAPLLDNSRRKIELMNALLFCLPGTPIIYYGDELGMGDNVYLGDRNGVRTPMQWTPDRNAGFSRTNPQKLFLPVIVDPEYHYEAVNVEVQQANTSSLLWWTKRLLALRREFRAFGQGSFEPLQPANRHVLTFLRRYGDETILVVANLSRFSQCVDLELPGYEGWVPVELFGHVDFPPIDGGAYRLSLGPHSFFLLSLERRADAADAAVPEEALPLVETAGPWQAALTTDRLQSALARWVVRQRWFRGKARRVRRTAVVDSVPVERGEARFEVAFVDVTYVSGDPETYVVPLCFRAGGEAGPDAVARLRLRSRSGEQREGWLQEASGDPELAAGLLETVMRRRRLRGREREIRGVPAPMLRRLLGDAPPPAARRMGVEQSNTSWLFGDRLVGKLLRRAEEGRSPEIEILGHLTERARFRHSPALAGHLEIPRGREEPATLALFQAAVANEGDAWQFTLDRVAQAFEEAIALGPDAVAPPVEPARLLERTRVQPSEAVFEFVGVYLENARLLGVRTGELHAALAAAEGDPALEPETLTPFARRSFYQSLRNLAVRAFGLLREQRASLAPADAELADRALGGEPRIQDRLRAILEGGGGGRLIRIHGDYHLGQVLYTGRDFVIIDFEGEPARSLGERRRKRSPLADVAGMVRSFHYAVENVLSGRVEGMRLRPEDAPMLRPWAAAWADWVSSGFLRAYLETVGPVAVLPEDPEDLALLLDVHLLEKALYEVAYELNNRPEWVGVPLRGILGLLGEGSAEV